MEDKILSFAELQKDEILKALRTRDVREDEVKEVGKACKAEEEVMDKSL